MATALLPIRRSRIRRVALSTDEVVRVHRPGHDGLAEARTGIDDRLVPPAGDRVRGEQDPGHGGIHHPLHHDGESHARGG